MESNNKKWPVKGLPISHYLKQTQVIKDIWQIIGDIPKDNEYLVALFLEELYSIAPENVDRWSALMVNFIIDALKIWQFEKVNVLLEKINIEKILKSLPHRYPLLLVD